jgi:hypothetical protein
MYTSHNLQNLSGEDKNKKRHSIQMEMVILESDQRKFLAEKNNLEVEMRKIKMDMERLRVDLDQKSQRYEKISWQIAQGEEEIKKFKKKLNLL